MAEPGIRPEAGDWRAVPMPHAPELLVHRLPAAGVGLTAFVRFGPGWARTAPVSCAVTEEFVVLSGGLDINGHRCGPGTLVWVPAGAVRHRTVSPHGCLALAWFAGAPRWRREPGPAPGPDPVRVHRLAQAPDGYAAATDAARWRLHHRLAGVPAEAACELVDLDAPAWFRLEAGEPEPAGGHRFLRRLPPAP